MSKQPELILTARLYLRWFLTGTADASVQAKINKYQQASHTEKLPFLKKQLLSISNKLTIDGKNALIIALEQEIHQVKKSEDGSAKERLNQFKKGFFTSAAKHNWKDVLLGVSSHPMLKMHNLHFPIVKKSEKTNKTFRALELVSPDVPAGAAFGMASIRENKDKASTSHDVSLCRYTYNHHHKINGALIAIGTASQGHDNGANNKAYFLLKRLARLASAIHDPNELSQKLPSLLAMANEAVNAKLPEAMGDDCSFAFARAWLQSDGTYRLVGINIGDSALYYFHPDTKRLDVVAPSTQYNHTVGNNKAYYRTLLYPQDKELSNLVPQKIDSILSQAGGVLVGFSGGAMQVLAPNLDPNCIFHEARFFSNTTEERKLSKRTLTKMNLDSTIHNTQTCIKAIHHQLDIQVHANMVKDKTLKNQKQNHTLMGLLLPANPKQARRSQWEIRALVSSYAGIIGLAALLGVGVIASGILLTLLTTFSPVGLIVGGLASLGLTIALTTAKLTVANILFWSAIGFIASLATGTLGGLSVKAGKKIYRKTHQYDAVSAPVFSFANTSPTLKLESSMPQHENEFQQSPNPEEPLLTTSKSHKGSF